MRELVKAFKALSDPNRLRIVKMLEVRPLCVCEITDVLGLATSTVSRHLSVLKEAGFVQDRKDGKWVVYELNRQSSNPYSRALADLLQGWLSDQHEVAADRDKLGFVDRFTICHPSSNLQR